MFPFRQFTAVPFQAISAMEYTEVGGMAQAVYLHLCRHHSSGVTTISIERLAHKLRCSARHVHDCLKALVGAGLIQIEERPGRASRYKLMAWFPDEQAEPTPAPPADVLEGSRNTSEDLPPSGGDPIRDQGSDLNQPRGIVGRVVNKVKAWNPVKPRKRPANWTPEPPVRPTPEPIEAPGELAPLEAGQPPTPEEQPSGQTWGELFGTPEPSPDEALAVGKKLILDRIGLAPDGCWRYSDQILTTEALLAYPRIRAVITPDDLAAHRAANQLPGLRVRC